MSQKEKAANVTLGLHRKSLEAVRIHACPKCGAPGVFKSDEHNKKNWPGVYRPEMPPNTPVGAVCPNCGASRTADTDLGELTASMPKWIWNTVLGFKWCLIQCISLGKRLRRVR